MKMNNSSLVNYTKKSPNHSGKRTHNVDRITPHCVVGQCSVETLGNIFAPKSRQASCNYAIGGDGRVALIVDEDNRAWTSSSNANDQRAITIECASDAYAPYAFRDVVYNKLIDLCTDICKRYGKTKLLWIPDKNKALAYEPKADEMLLTVHRWFANKSCPGDWMFARMGDLAAKVTARLGSTSATPTQTKSGGVYRVRKSWKDAKSQVGAYKNLNSAKKEADKHPGYSVFDANGNKVYPASAAPTQTTSTSYKVKITADVLRVRQNPTTDSKIMKTVKRNEVYTIVHENNGWGKLKSGDGWISLSYTKKV